MSLSTDPKRVHLRLRARRPAAFNLVFQKKDRRTRIDMTGATVTFIMGDVEQDATVVNAELGMLRVDLQADDLNLKPNRDYPFDLRLRTASGFVVSVLQGDVSITPNPDASVPTDYDPASVQPTDSLTVTMLGRETYVVQTDHTPDLVLASTVEHVEILRGQTMEARDEALASVATVAEAIETIEDVLQQVATVNAGVAAALAAQTAAETARTQAQAAASTAAQSRTDAATYAGSAQASKNSAAGSEGAAGTSAAAASSSAVASAGSATTAAGHASTASTKAGEAATSATTATTKAGEASASAGLAAAARDTTVGYRDQAKTYRDEALASSSAMPFVDGGTGLETMGTTLDAQKSYRYSMASGTPTSLTLALGSGWAHGARTLLRVATTSSTHHFNTITILGEDWSTYGQTDRLFEIRQVGSQRFVMLLDQLPVPNFMVSASALPGNTLKAYPGAHASVILNADLIVSMMVPPSPEMPPFHLLVLPTTGNELLTFVNTSNDIEVALPASGSYEFSFDPRTGLWDPHQLRGPVTVQVDYGEPVFGVGAAGPAGPTGATGPAGPTGPAGSGGGGGPTTVTSYDYSASSDSTLAIVPNDDITVKMATVTHVDLPAGAAPVGAAPAYLTARNTSGTARNLEFRNVPVLGTVSVVVAAGDVVRYRLSSEGGDWVLRQTSGTTEASIPGSSPRFSVPTAYLLKSGTGSPIGAQTGAKGMLYQDTAQTNGATLWIKTSPAGNTAWRVVEGDTGWREVPLSDGDRPGIVQQIRRINGTTRYRIKWGVNQTGDHWFRYLANLPGFTLPTGGTPIIWPGGGIVGHLVVGWDTLCFSGGMTTVDANSVAETSWPVDQAWPSSLPGTPATTI